MKHLAKSPHPEVNLRAGRQRARTIFSTYQIRIGPPHDQDVDSRARLRYTKASTPRSTYEMARPNSQKGLR
jgi:hypothetical protein